MPIHIASRRRSAATLVTEFPGARIIDVTSKADEPWVRLSPFYPHGGIPVPLTAGVTAQSVEGIWQALKVFESAGTDPAKLDVTGMTGLKRTVRRYGPVLGHRDGLYGEGLLPYETARRRIYLPAYRWVLEHRTAGLVEDLRGLAGEQDVVLLDYTTNGDVADLATPLSHAALVRLHILGRWPEEMS
ncbi:hypothetical protein GCM10027176_42730 [Actinoallomurus bryophytorum]|uniref:Uncharacterized protein n=1 Tax=Actinoallomurus bryophytorum TaxID=1490222 RepID=A0A543CDW0_9ACTN|nr:hypothetical protein [Actinoallomurus bryophytorum]TQL95292.1 hypothetical protein FB559_0793 [Actinoallomurus bryophytorum]